MRGERQQEKQSSGDLQDLKVVGSSKSRGPMTRDIFERMECTGVEEAAVAKMSKMYSQLLRLHRQGLLPSESVQFFQIEFINLMLSAGSSPTLRRRPSTQ